MLGNIFTHEMKPMEVEILVAEVGLAEEGDQMFHLLYDGTVVDARDYAAIGGDAEAVRERLAATWSAGLDRSAAVQVGLNALSGPDREISAAELEVAELSRSHGRRCFSRIDATELAAILA